MIKMEVTVLNLKKLFAVSILLIVFTIGAASASENMTDEMPLESSTDDERLESVYYDDDFYVTVPENYSHDKKDWTENEIVYISSSSQENGTFRVLVDDAEKLSFDVTNGYFSVEDGGYGGTYKNYIKFIYPTDLGLDVGTYNVKVKFKENTLIDTQVNIKQKEDFDIWLQNPYYCLEDYWTSPSFIIIDSNHLNNGTLEIFVNGSRKLTYNVKNGDFEEIPDCSNKSRYISASDLLAGYGKYKIQINFTENGTTHTLKDETVTVAERAPTTDPKLEAYLDLYTVNLPADNVAHIYLPWEATGTLTVSYNNVKNEVVPYSNGRAQHYIHAWNLNHLGENTLTFTYVGEDFGTLKTTVSCIVVPTITAPFIVSLGEEFKISMMTHEWVNGKFNVYDYKLDKKGKLLVSGNIFNRLSTVALSSNTLGLNKFYLEFAYPGGYYPIIQEVYVVKNSENIRVALPLEVNVGSDVAVNITAPAISYCYAYISVDGVNRGFYSMENGSVVETISGLSKGYHTISVQYNNGYFSNGYLMGDVYSNTFAVCVGSKTSIAAPQVTTVYNVAKDLTVNLKDTKGNVLSGRTVTIKLNGVTYRKTTDKNGQVRLSVNLPAKNYIANIYFAGDDSHIGSSADAKIIVGKAKPKITAKSKTFKAKTKIKKVTATLKDNKGRVMKNIKLTLKIKNKKYTAKTGKKGVAIFKVKLTKKGKYLSKITFKGNNNYRAVTKTIKIKIK